MRVARGKSQCDPFQIGDALVRLQHDENAADGDAHRLPQYGRFIRAASWHFTRAFKRVQIVLRTRQENASSNSNENGKYRQVETQVACQTKNEKQLVRS